MTEKEKHLYHYLTLILVFAVCFILFAVFKYNYDAKLGIAIFFSVFYSFWGIIHHAVEGRLTAVVVLEYILLSVFVLFLLLTYIV